MRYGMLLLFAQCAAGFLTLDLFFRFMDVRALPGRAWLYGGLGAVVCGVALWVGWVTGGLGGLLIALPGPVIWWMLWRFGLRKQLTYLFKDDGGRPLDTPKPDP